MDLTLIIISPGKTFGNRTKMRNLTEQLSRLLAQTSDYVSFEFAIFLHGLSEKCPDIIRIVTTGRRRPRKIAGYQIEFIYHKASRPAETASLVCDGISLQVATLSQALIDIVSDIHLNLPAELIATWFWQLPYSFDRLLALATRTSNSAVKRALFWGLWSGRADLEKLNGKGFSKSPVAVLPGDSAKQLWEGSIQVFYPAWLLAFSPESKHEIAHNQLKDWLQMRRLPSFINFMVEKQWLAIAGDRRRESADHLHSFFRSELHRQMKSNLTGLLQEIAGGTAEDSEQALPEQFLRWARQSSEFSEKASAIVKEWCIEALNGSDEHLIELAVLYAPKVGLIAEALERLKSLAGQIFVAGCCRGVIELCQQAEIAGIKVPFALMILQARIAARNNDFSTAIMKIDKALATRGVTENEELDAKFAAGVIYRQAGQVERAVQYFENALVIAQGQDNRERTAAIKSAMGNAYFVTGELKKARSCYLNAFALCRSNIETVQTANLKTNLGLVELKTGRLKKADRYFQQAANQQKRMKNQQGELVSLMALAKIKLAMGQVNEAVKLLNRVHKSAAQQTNAVVDETRALLAWCHELLGRPEKSDHYWQMIAVDGRQTLPAASRFLIDYFKALHLFLRCDLEQAEANLGQLIEFGKSNNVTSDEIAFALFYKALAIFLQKNEDSVTVLDEALKLLSNRQNHPFYLLAESFAAIAFPMRFRGIDTDLNYRTIIHSEYYEPLWPFMAETMGIMQSTSYQSLLSSYENKISQGFKDIMEKRSPVCRRLFRKLARINARIQCFNLITDKGEKQLTLQQYHEWAGQKPGNKLSFDSCSGRLSFGRNSLVFKTKSISCQLCLHLLSAFPGAISVASLYEMVWAGKYDPDCDWPAVKTAVSRLRKSFKQLNSLIEVRTGNSTGQIQIELKLPYEIMIQVGAT